MLAIYWGKSLAYTIYFMNLTLTTSLDYKAPLQSLKNAVASPKFVD